MPSRPFSSMTATASSSTDGRASQSTNQNRLQAGENHLIELDLKKARPRNNWTARQRILLCWFPLGLPGTTLNIQWEDMRKRTHNVWRHVHLETDFSDGEKLFSTIFQDIKSAAQKAGIPLKRRSADILDTRKSSVVGKRAKNDSKSTHIDPESKRASDESSAPARVPLEMPVPVNLQDFRFVRPQVHTGKNIPNLVWRWANYDSQGINSRYGYVAYVFTDRIGSIPSPGEYKQHEFRSMLENHVHQRRIPSPFISTSSDPLTVIHRALRNNNHTIVTLIDTTQIDGSLCFSMAELLAQHGIQTLRYTGRTEYLIWGAIPKSAIVMTFRIDDLVKITEQNADIQAVLQLDKIANSPHYWASLTQSLQEGNQKTDVVAGAAIGKLFRLLQVPRDFIEDVAQMMNQSWRFVSEDHLTEYLRGVWKGSQQVDRAVNGDTAVVNSPSAERTNNRDFLSVISSSTPRPEDPEPSSRASDHTDPIRIDDNEDFIFVDTPCPCRRLAKTRDSRPVLKERQPQLQTPESSLKRKRSGFKIEVYKPDTNLWSPVQQNQNKRATMPSGSDKENDYIVIDDDADHEVEGKREDQGLEIKTEKENGGGDVENTASFIVIDEAPPSPASSVSTLMGFTPDEQFDMDRARVTRIMEYNWAQFYKTLQETAAEEPASASSSSSKSLD